MKIILINTLILISFLFSCRSEPEKQVETAPPDKTETRTETQVPENRDTAGTSVQISNEGVNVRHKDAEGKGDVKLSTDTVNIDIKKK